MEFISITNDTLVAKYFEECGVNHIMVDLEYLGKAERQKGLNTVKSNHNYDDVTKIKSALTKSSCLVRINPINNNSKKEIDKVVNNGADIIMLPFFTTKEEVEFFTSYVGSRAQKFLLLETAQALTRLDDIINVEGIDAIHVGLNDLSISLGLEFLYEPLIGGLVEYISLKVNKKKIKFGFGGVSRLEKGKNILAEHFRLGSQMVILNRDFRSYKDTYSDIIEHCNIQNEIIKITTFLETLKTCSYDEIQKYKLSLYNEIKTQMKTLK